MDERVEENKHGYQSDSINSDVEQEGSRLLKTQDDIKDYEPPFLEELTKTKKKHRLTWL